MDDEEYEDDVWTEVPDEDLQIYVARKNNKWLYFAIVLELVENVFQDVSTAFADFKMATIQRFQWQNDRQTFFENASRELEKLEITED